MDKTTNKQSHQDIIAWSCGIIFIVSLLGAMFGLGISRNWYAPSGHFHYDTNNSQERFMTEPYGCNETSLPGRSGVACDTSWYYWKLKPEEVTSTTNALVWTLYALHQLFVWGLIYRAQLTVTMQNKTKQEKYSGKMGWFNWSLLGVNGLFHVLHLVQTHTTYDATAQTVVESSSQSSVVMMIAFIILMEYKHRGLFFMWPSPDSTSTWSKRLRLNMEPIELVRRYHGYCFSWAVIYTFWYHPMENQWGHALGFFHTAIVMLQGSLIYTHMHLNPYWRLLNEAWVLIHATVVAFQTGNPDVSHRGDLWPMFFMGFAFLFSFTQIYTLPFWKKSPPWTRTIPPILFFVIVIAMSATIIPGKNPDQTGFSRMYEMVFIPAEEYMACLYAWAVIYIFLKIESKIKKIENDKITPSPTKQAVCLCLFMMIYIIFILISYFMQQTHSTLMPLTTQMIILVFVFIFGANIGFMLVKQIMGCSQSTINRSHSKIYANDNAKFEEDSL